MSDIALNFQGDLIISSGKIGLVYDSEYRRQRVAIALKHSMGEWFRDQGAGTDYDGAIRGKSTELSRRAEVRRRVLGVPGIAEITAMDTSMDASARRWSADIQAMEVDGQPLELRFDGTA